MRKSPSVTSTLINRASKDGNLEKLNNKEHVEIIREMNKNLESARREYKIKEIQSIDSASKAVLTI